jgi:competence ComEA-like helix-hairpin-helix protein
MIKKIISEYFVFTRKERIGVIVLAILIIVVFLLPMTFSNGKNKNEELALAAFKDEIAKLKFADEGDSIGEKNHLKEAHTYREESKNIIARSDKINLMNRLFYFDPNKLSESGWKELGISNKTITTIQHFLGKGGKFYQPEDLRKIYGLRESDFDRLVPFIKIQKNITRPQIENESIMSPKHIRQEYAVAQKEIKLIDINQADSAELIQVKGVGSKLASRILHFRDRLGGFYNINQLSELYGLSDSSFQLIKSQLIMRANDTLRQIDINAADLFTLQKHPYIRWDLAKAIIEYRREHGPFKAREDLLQLALLDPSKLERLAPYLKIN